jgi:hypothetical protein
VPEDRLMPLAGPSPEQMLKNLVLALSARDEADRQVRTAHADAASFFREEALTEKRQRDKAQRLFDARVSPAWPALAENAEFGPRVAFGADMRDGPGPADHPRVTDAEATEACEAAAVYAFVEGLGMLDGGSP